MIERSQHYAAKIFSITYLVTYAIIAVAFSHFYDSLPDMGER